MLYLNDENLPKNWLTRLSLVVYNITCKVINLNSLQVIILLEKMVRMGELFDFYGQLLTERQQEFMTLYYQQDFSLGEIAERFGISRQAIHDNLRRSEKILEEYDQKLELLARTKMMKNKIQTAIEMIEDFAEDFEQQDKILDLLRQVLDS